MTEFDLKQEQIQALLAGRGLDALLLQRVSSFAWATCGAASNEVPTEIEGWPMLPVRVGDAEYARPATLEVL